VIFNYDLKLDNTGQAQKTLLSNKQFLMWNATFSILNKINHTMIRCHSKLVGKWFV